MMIRNSIGAFWFLNFDRPPDGCKQHVDLVQRPGVNGSAFWKEGFWGDPVFLTTHTDCATPVLAWNAYTLYAQLIGASPVELVYAGFSMRAWGFDVEVKNVQPKQVTPLLMGLGGLSHQPGRTYGALLIAEWELVPVSIV